ncbi:hypothetical protein GGD71_000928 [Variovorax guangxiensis]|nr:hypothetical protein [Variovorax guangxiensis]
MFRMQKGARIESLVAPQHLLRSLHSTMISPTAKEIFIQGITKDGRTFRPSDWAERLAGVMCSFRPGGAYPGSHLSYSPWCIPTTINGVKCVVVNRALRDAEPMAWDFCVNFARDNDLQVAEACLVPDAPIPPKKA